MTIHVYNPGNHETVKLHAWEETKNGQLGWHICVNPDEDIFIVQCNGQWEVTEGKPLDPDLLDELGKCLHPLALVNTLHLRRLAAVYN
ncbi:hypothetical protein HH214_02590 [Mucilaginibacter robiniae]|uniref:Uncharacterized protein n=1 Tax=Mucilaginibacter robiniae TaxID=2728022 RepID=A0A7L5DUW7_9SPHI|nr:hypothetical protein [Mucilaginibacter robiniae]QJD94842.1 hypothetical protein HH214_02590 [Mucilaginibacter robiniae]